MGRNNDNRAIAEDIVSQTVSESTLAELLRARGLRVTRQRLAILKAVGVGEHLDADTVAHRVSEDLGPTSRQTIYDALAACAEAGLLRRIEPAGSPMLYERASSKKHHHLICRQCHTIVDVDCLTGETPCLHPATDAGFEVDEAEVTFWGLCPNCQAARAQDNDSRTSLASV
jgi:Fur family ferric uptake transcriptional regulator